MGDIKLGPRIKALREKAELSQEQMARLLGVGSHQIVSQIEAGDRRLKAEELLTIVQAFNVPLDILTNPFLINGEGRFSWRQNNVPAETLDAYELKAGEWIGAIARCASATGERFPAYPASAGPGASRSTFEDAASHAAEALVEDLDLGDVPGSTRWRASWKSAWAYWCSWWKPRRAFRARPASSRNWGRC